MKKAFLQEIVEEPEEVVPSSDEIAARLLAALVVHPIEAVPIEAGVNLIVGIDHTLRPLTLKIL